MSKEQIKTFLENATGKLTVTYNWDQYSNSYIEFENVPAPIMGDLSKIIADKLVKVHGHAQPRPEKPDKPKDSQPEGPITLEATLYKDPVLKYVDTKKGSSAIGNFYCEAEGTRYSFGIWGAEGERAVDGLSRGDRVKVEGKLVVNGKFNNIESATLLEPKFGKKAEPPYERPGSDDDDIPF